MNLVALLIAPLVVRYGTGGGGHLALRIVVCVGAVLILGGAIWYSKTRRLQLLLPEEAVPEAEKVEEIASRAVSPSRPAPAS